MNTPQLVRIKNTLWTLNDLGCHETFQNYRAVSKQAEPSRIFTSVCCDLKNNHTASTKNNITWKIKAHLSGGTKQIRLVEVCLHTESERILLQRAVIQRVQRGV